MGAVAIKLDAVWPYLVGFVRGDVVMILGVLAGTKWTCSVPEP